METPDVNKVKIYKGLQKILIAILLMFIGPIIIYSSFKNEGHFMYYPVLIFGCLMCLFSMYLFFMGLRTLVSGFFND
ncbi:hypothetical protein SAMN02927937_02536 [Paenimyroides aquimaris]|uniref:Uncharacterized protein n=1 Tax=Paenimyroides marinum TaxID=1159016 RepID=A0A1H6MLB4_9FLAO|nr:DUF6095 family protein [Paenimyroides aquimaris]SEH98400.1 hypothetical protein SAMN02927937_02536 [Paenimyroides aquimaris]